MPRSRTVDCSRNWRRSRGLDLTIQWRKNLRGRVHAPSLENRHILDYLREVWLISRQPKFFLHHEMQRAGKNRGALSSFGACLSEFADRLSPERFGILSMSQTADSTALLTLCRFLGIAEPDPSPRVHHATTKPKSRTLNYLARNSIDTLLPRGSKVNAQVNNLRQQLFLLGRKPEKPSETLRRK